MTDKIDLTYLRPLKRKKVADQLKSLKKKDRLTAIGYEKAVVLPGKDRNGGVVDRENRFIEESATDWFGGHYGFDADDVTDDDRKAVYLGAYMDDCWGHIIVCLLVRFWYFRKNDSSIDTYVITSLKPGQKFNNKPLNEILALFGVSDRIEFVDKPIRFREVVIPERSFTPGSYSDEFMDVLDTIRDRALEMTLPEEGPKKIFLSRSHYYRAKNNEAGLALLDHYFEKNGFAIVYPEERSLADLIQLLQGAEVCASESGSITFNTLFSKNGLNVIIIERLAIFADGNLAVNLSDINSITYIDGSYTIHPVNVGEACILGYTEEFRRYSNDHNMLHPDAEYTSAEYLQQCFERYTDQYNTQKRELDKKKSSWLPVIREARERSVALFPQAEDEETKAAEDMSKERNRKWFRRLLRLFCHKFKSG